MKPLQRAYENREKYVERRGSQEASVAKRVERGYVRAYEKQVVDEGRKGRKRKVELSYRENGQPGRRQRKERKQTVSWGERWGRRARGGTGRRETTEGRRTVEEARKQELGGKRKRWVI